MGYDLSPLGDIAKKFLAVYRKNDENNPMTNFDERDLILFWEIWGLKKYNWNTQLILDLVKNLKIGIFFTTFLLTQILQVYPMHLTKV